MRETSRVPPDVIAGFGLQASDAVVPWGAFLAGGRGPAYRYGNVVVKPIIELDEARAIADVMHAVDVDPSLVRVARPVAARDGDWVVDGWSAWHVVDGVHLHSAHDRHAEALLAIDELHRALKELPGPAALAVRRHRWAAADRIAWDEASESHEVDDSVSGLDPRLQALVDVFRSEIDERVAADDPVTGAQLVHGDLWANLLFHPELAPAVIDFSPYWRPCSYAKAIYAFDAMAWGGAAGPELLELMAPDADVVTHLLRAAIFRIAALDGIRRERGADIGPHLPAFEAMVPRLLRLIESSASRSASASASIPRTVGS